MVYTEVYNIEDGLGTIQVSTALLLVACINHVQIELFIKNIEIWMLFNPNKIK